ncbi:BppU family phage baseplate upper protein [Bacillus sp. SM-B1]|uniref:BppU family phage baseplate upper protein n=1 Tax=Bacillus sp. SM-B1 TaxID=2980102 RepID=UPI00294A2639|nr:BppU family phage baseplate upper protein [Bacillus sp. SM-B1]MDV6040372.1 BppU family phage baseplate upper protein [Bacillus sp. SM-B1]
MFKTYEITVDLISDTAAPSSAIRFSTNDRNAAKLLLTITNKGAEIDLSQAKSVRISFKKPDGTRVFQNDCQPINALKGKYQIVLKTQTLAAEGYVYAQIHIEEADRVVDTQTFFFVVNESLASNQAIESINELSIIQKAIEAGQKLDGKDIDGIIAAGAKADAALPKAGGTMTGNVDMDVSVGAKSKGYRWRDATNTIYGIESATDGELILYDYKNLARVWQYDPVAKRFTVLSDTNLLKNTGDTIRGTVIMEAGDFRFKNPASDILFRNNQSGIFVLYDIAQDQVIWTYDSKTKEFKVGAASNLLKLSGGTLTGNLMMDVSASNKYFGWRRGDGKTHFLYAGDDIVGLYSEVAKVAKTPWKYTPSTETFEVLAPNTNLVTKVKDGRATLTLTADATNVDTTVGTFADRRGNTVTVKMAVKRNAGSTGQTVAELPTDMRPTSVITQMHIATDGTPVKVLIDTTGKINVATENKNIYLLMTYVVD